MYLFNALSYLVYREFIRFFRQRGRVLGTLLTPLLFWLVMALGFNEVLRYFPGTLLMVVLFTAIFASISIIEDRREGFLQGALCTPVPRALVMLGKVIGGAVIACAQGAVILICAAFGTDLQINLTTFAEALVVLFPSALLLGSIGFFFAWRLDSVQGFHAVMNLILFPMWLLSGAFFSLTEATPIMRWIMKVNPLHYSYSMLLDVFEQKGFIAYQSMFILCFSTIIFLAVSLYAISQPEKS